MCWNAFISSLRFSLLSVLLILTACGGGSQTVVSIAPHVSSFNPGGNLVFTATVHNNQNPTVTWSLSGAGSLVYPPVNAGVPNPVQYFAPTTQPPNPSVTLTATAVGDSKAKGSVTFKIQ